MSLKRIMSLLLILAITSLYAESGHENKEESEALHTSSTHIEHAEDVHHEGGIVDFPVMQEHLIGRNKFEIPNLIHITHPIEIYVPIWIVPTTDKITLQNGFFLQKVKVLN